MPGFRLQAEGGVRSRAVRTQTRPNAEPVRPTWFDGLLAVPGPEGPKSSGAHGETSSCEGSHREGSKRDREHEGPHSEGPNLSAGKRKPQANLGQRNGEGTKRLAPSSETLSDPHFSRRGRDAEATEPGAWCCVVGQLASVLVVGELDRQVAVVSGSIWLGPSSR
jgi:hypothetical protein